MLLLQARAAGYLEGWVTRELLHMQYLNTIVGRFSTVQCITVQYSEVTKTIVGRCDGKQPLCDKINQWVANNTAWVRSQLEKHRWVE